MKKLSHNRSLVEKRQRAVSKNLPRFAYVISDVIVYIGEGSWANTEYRICFFFSFFPVISFLILPFRSFALPTFASLLLLSFPYSLSFAQLNGPPSYFCISSSPLLPYPPFFLHPAKFSILGDNVVSFANAAVENVASAIRPCLVIVHNKSGSYEPMDPDVMTNMFLTLHGEEV